MQNKDNFSQMNLGFKILSTYYFPALKIRLSRTKTTSLNYCCWLICSPCSDIVSPLLIVMIVPVFEKQWKIFRHNGLSCTCRGFCNNFAQHCDLIIVHILIVVHNLIIVHILRAGDVETMAIIASPPAPSSTAHLGPDIADLLIPGLITCDPKIPPRYAP